MSMQVVRLKLYQKLLLLNNFNSVIKRFKHKDTHWSVAGKKKQAIHRALEHFDDFYKKVYEDSWSSIRQGLLKQKKHVAVLNYYGDIEKTRTDLENSGAINLKTLLDLQKQYLKEQKYENVKNKTLEQVYKLDKEIDDRIKNEDLKLGAEKKIAAYKDSVLSTLSESARGAESFLLYQDDNPKTEIKARQEKPPLSVVEGLKQADIDYSRIIVPETMDASTILYQFIPATKLKGKEDWIPETQHYRYYENTNEFSVKIEKEYDLNFPEHLQVYCYEQNNYTKFPIPKRGSIDVYNYYLLDGASILPVLSLGLKPGDKLLDMCSSPGGKAYVAFQTLYPDIIVCNDVDLSRVYKIEKVLHEYLYDLNDKWLKTGRLKIWQTDGIELKCEGLNKILVDVPCTNDRQSVSENDNNWFKGSRTKERLQLPETQAALLTNALKMVSVGGCVVYSTCSLSPIQNDGVVNMALRNIWEETDIQVTVKDLTPALQCTKCVFKYADSRLLKYGHLVVPYLPQNYGPMYFCKIERNK